jgi:transposase-like protein
MMTQQIRKCCPSCGSIHVKKRTRSQKLTAKQLAKTNDVNPLRYYCAVCKYSFSSPVEQVARAYNFKKEVAKW